MKATSKKKRRWVIKAGSNMICQGGPLLIRDWMIQVARLKREKNIEVIWVSSGAIATAVERQDFHKKTRSLAEKQALSAIGQPLVMDLYNIALQTQGMLGAQVLLTYDDLARSKQKTNLRNTIEQLLKWEVVPVLNENDAVATEEIRFGDNDSLSARIAVSLEAERLIILTDVSGFYERDPRAHPDAKLIHELSSITPKLLKATQAATEGKAGSTRGTGGMSSKLIAAKYASDAGIETWLVKGDEPQVLIQVSENTRIGTRIGS